MARKIPRGELRENLLIAITVAKELEDIARAILENQLAMPSRQIQLRDTLEVLRALIEPVVAMPPARFTRVFTVDPARRRKP